MWMLMQFSLPAPNMTSLWKSMPILGDWTWTGGGTNAVWSLDAFSASTPMHIRQEKSISRDGG
jgi:hypothetical protein